MHVIKRPDLSEIPKEIMMFIIDKYMCTNNNYLMSIEVYSKSFTMIKQCGLFASCVNMKQIYHKQLVLVEIPN